MALNDGRSRPSSSSQGEWSLICLPEPYSVFYGVERTSHGPAPLQLRHVDQPKRATNNDCFELRELKNNEELFFSPPISALQDQSPSLANNTPWARARRSPHMTIAWSDNDLPSLVQIWNIFHAVFTNFPENEQIRVKLEGTQWEQVSQELRYVGLAIDHPVQEQNGSNSLRTDEIVVLRCAFWQGAGSPFGPRPAWVANPTLHNTLRKQLTEYPLMTQNYTITTRFPDARVHAWHPVRAAKPSPGSLIYSRWIPWLEEHFSMTALDYKNEIHLNLFHNWQNDPRVSAGWNETGTLDQHRDYLRKLHDDPHTITILAKFEDTFFAYFEVYWAKEDHLGAYYDAGDYDRGRHSLVGDTRFRGPHRVSAWWSSLMHYIFLDDPRTQYVVGEPKSSNTTVLAYDFANGFGLEKWVDLPHKRSAFVKCSRERFFQLAPFTWDGKDPARAAKL